MMDFCRQNAPGPDLLPLTYVLALRQDDSAQMMCHDPIYAPALCHNEAFCGEALAKIRGKDGFQAIARCGAREDWGKACAFLCACAMYLVSASWVHGSGEKDIKIQDISTDA